MSLLTIRHVGDLSAVNHRGDTLSIGSRRTQAAIVWMALHLDAEAPLRDFETLFGDDAAALARDLQYAFRFLPPRDFEPLFGDAAAALARDLQYAFRFPPPRLLEGDGPSLRFNAASVEVDALRLLELDANGSIRAVPAA